MATVETVGGRIDVGALGPTLIHEHFFSSDEAISAQWPEIRDHERDFRFALEAANAVIAHGVKTVVEPTPMLLGRDVRASQRLASESGLQLVSLHRDLYIRSPAAVPAERLRGFHGGAVRARIERGIRGTDI
jgi:phosphotriesterase-related protein